MNRRDTVLGLLALGAAIGPLNSHAQQQPKLRRIGALAYRSRSTAARPEVFYDSVLQGLSEFGYVDGKNIRIEWRFAEGEVSRLPGLASELVRTNPEVIVTHSTPATEALKKATTTIPIVTGAVIDPIASGFAASLAHPGGNITGFSVVAVDLSPKFMELLKTMRPTLTRIAFLTNPNNRGILPMLKAFEVAAQKANINTLSVEAGTAEEIDGAFANMKKERIDALVVANDSFFPWRRKQITALTLKYRIPTMFPWREDVEAGGLMSYGQNLGDVYRRTASFVDKILKGARPQDLPFEQPTKLELVINQRSAKALGITIPQELLLRADEVIE